MISGSTRYARSLGFIGGLGADSKVNTVEKIFGMNIEPDPDAGAAGGVRVVARPSAIIGGLIGGMIGAAIGPSKGKNYLSSALIGSAVGFVAIGALSGLRSMGW